MRRSDRWEVIDHNVNRRGFVAAEFLRDNRTLRLNIARDRGRREYAETAARLKVFKGERINGHHLTMADKRAARKA